MRISLLTTALSLALVLLIASVLSLQQKERPRSTVTWSNNSVVRVEKPLAVSPLPLFESLSSTVALPQPHTTPVEQPLRSTDAPIDATLPQKQPTVAEYLSETWSLIPTGLRAITDTTKERSVFQQSLYEYGNEAGRILEALDASVGRRQVIIMRDFHADRENATKQQAVIALARHYTETGDALLNIAVVPESIKTYHDALATGYTELGKKLPGIAMARSDESLLAAIDTYNEAVHAFIAPYASLAEYFSTAGVTFADDEPGRMFMFSGQGGL